MNIIFRRWKTTGNVLAIVNNKKIYDNKSLPIAFNREKIKVINENTTLVDPTDADCIALKKLLIHQGELK